MCKRFDLETFTTIVKISLTVSTGEPGHDQKCDTVKKINKYKQSVNKPFGEVEFTDNSMSYHTIQELTIFDCLYHEELHFVLWLTGYFVSDINMHLFSCQILASRTNRTDQ